jgi:hypothetical protein
MTRPQSAKPKKTVAMSDPSRLTRFEGRQGDTAAHECAFAVLRDRWVH